MTKLGFCRIRLRRTGQKVAEVNSRNALRADSQFVFEQVLIKGRASGQSGWSTVTANGQNTGSKTVYGLAPGVTYEWKVRTLCNQSAGIVSGYTPLDQATTIANNGARLAGNAVIENTEEPMSFSVYPNPASGLVNLSFQNSWQQQVLDVEFYNGNGQLVKSFSAKADEKISIDVSRFQAGIYHLIVSNEEVVEIRMLAINN